MLAKYVMTSSSSKYLLNARVIDLYDYIIVLAINNENKSIIKTNISV